MKFLTINEYACFSDNERRQPVETECDCSKNEVSRMTDDASFSGVRGRLTKIVNSMTEQFYNGVSLMTLYQHLTMNLCSADGNDKICTVGWKATVALKQIFSPIFIYKGLRYSLHHLLQFTSQLHHIATPLFMLQYFLHNEKKWGECLNFRHG